MDTSPVNSLFIMNNRYNMDIIRKALDQLYVNRARLDRVITEFLDGTELKEEDTTTPEWVQYKKLLEQYNDIESLINLAAYTVKANG